MFVLHWVLQPLCSSLPGTASPSKSTFLFLPNITTLLGYPLSMTSQRAKTREKLSEIGHSEQSEAKTFSSWITYTGKLHTDYGRK